MSKTHDTVSVSPTEMLAAAASQLYELVESAREDDQKFKFAYDGLSAGIDDASEAEIKLYRPQLDCSSATGDDRQWAGPFEGGNR